MALEKPDNTGEWTAEGIEPSAGKKATGWAAGGKLPAPYLNWFWALASSWFAWLNQFFHATGSSNENLVITAPGDVQFSPTGSIIVSHDIYLNDGVHVESNMEVNGDLTLNGETTVVGTASFGEMATFNGDTVFNSEVAVNAPALFEDDAIFQNLQLDSVEEIITLSIHNVILHSGSAITFGSDFGRVSHLIYPSDAAAAHFPVLLPKGGTITQIEAWCAAGSGSQEMRIALEHFSKTAAPDASVSTSSIIWGIVSTTPVYIGVLANKVIGDDIHWIGLYSRNTNSDVVKVSHLQVHVTMTDVTTFRMG